MKKLMLLFFLAVFSFHLSANPVYPSAYEINKSFLCGTCYVNNAVNTIDNDAASFATMHVPLGLLANLDLVLSFSSQAQAGSLISMIVEDPTSTLDLLSSISYTLWNNHTAVDNTGWTISNIAGSTTKKLLITTNTATFNKISIRLAGVVSAGKTLNVFTTSFDLSPLPIQLIAFEGKVKEKTIALSWKTDVEINNAYFEIEKSKDLQQWQQVGRLWGATYSKTILSYGLIDAYPEKGVNYYRLKQVDKDSSYVYSKIISISYESASEMEILDIYPNPIKSKQPLLIKIHTLAEKRQVPLLIYASNGKLAYQQTIYLEAGVANAHVTPDLQPGLYYLRIPTGKGILQQKLLVD